MTTVRVRALLMPTESEEKVMRALETVIARGTITKNALPDGTFEILSESSSLQSLTPLRDLLKRERIRSAARSIFFASQRGSTISFGFNKQVAYAGKISFATSDHESPLGPIMVTIQADDPNHVIDWLAPQPLQR